MSLFRWLCCCAQNDEQSWITAVSADTDVFVHYYHAVNLKSPCYYGAN